jgi:hypothetical protein
MNTITLKTNGHIAADGKMVESDPLMFLGHMVELEEGYTLRSFFRLFEKYALLSQLNAFLPDCIEQYLDCPKNHCKSDDIDHLEFNKTVEMIGFPGEPRLEIYNALRGVHGKQSCEIKSFRLESLLDLPLKLGMLKHIIFGDKVDVFEFETVFSLFEFIDGIVWELSFQGTPKECAI